MVRRKDRFNAAILLILLTILLNGCAGGQTTQKVVITEYFLKEAGFRQWEVNMDTPKRQALMDSIPKGKIVTYLMDGVTYHVYSDQAAQTLYVGDEVAYQKYLSMSMGKQVCERVDATDSEKFWSCFDDFQKAGER